MNNNIKITLASLVVFTMITLFTLTLTSAVIPSEIIDETDKVVSEIKVQTDLIDLTTGQILDVVSKPIMKVWGTEYVPGDEGMVWLQVLNETSQPITNSTCFLSSWYPNGTYFLNGSVMAYLDEGIHYREFTVPDTTGVYRQSTLCSFPRLIANYSETYNITSFDDIETGDGKGGYGFVVDWQMDEGGGCSVVSSGTPINGTYHLRCKQDGASAARISNGTLVGEPVFLGNISFWAKGNSIEAGESYVFQVFDGNSWIEFQRWEDGIHDDNVYRYYEYELSQEFCQFYVCAYIFRFYAEGTDNSDYLYIDNVTVKRPEVLNYYENNETEYVYVYGSGEIHVNYPWTQNAYIWLTSVLSGWMNNTSDTLLNIYVQVNNTYDRINDTYNLLTSLNITTGFTSISTQITNSTDYLSNLIFNRTSILWNDSVLPYFTSVAEDLDLLKMMALCSPLGYPMYGYAYFGDDINACNDFMIAIKTPSAINDPNHTWIDSINDAFEYINDTAASNYVLDPLHNFLESPNPMNASRMGIIETGIRLAYSSGYVVFKFFEAIF